MTRISAALLILALLAGATLCQDAPAWQPPEGAKFTAEDVSIERKEGEGAFQIAGTLRVPTGDKPGAGWPAVLFVSGSGSQTRHGFQGKLDIGTWEVLDAVANAGFVVLATDDRGIGATPMGAEGVKPTEIGYNHLLGDARACLDWLKAREGVNKQRVFVIGHSEGGLTAPILAGESEIAGVVYMAAAGRNMYDITLEQVEASMAKLPKATRDANLKAQREFQDAVKEGREPDFNILGAAAAPALKNAWKLQVEPIKAWWHDHFNLDVPALQAKVKCPVFVAQGAADFQVSPERDAKQIVKDLMAGECADVKLKIYADLDHLFKPCNGKPSEMKMYFEDRRVDPAFIRDIVQWLEDHR
ncbi:MAG: Esterase EstD [Planctomycetes bacterium]|nr:Esterase EstD [Planctomycetota bacterium]